MTTEIDNALKALASRAEACTTPFEALQFAQAVSALADAKTQLFYASAEADKLNKCGVAGDPTPNLVGGPDPGNGPG